MTDDVARDPADSPAAAGQSEDRPKRSRRRGRRAKTRPMEGQSAVAQPAPDAGQQPAAEPARAAARGGRKSGAQKGAYAPFNDGLDRFVCPECLRFLPLAYPVQHRRGTATISLREVARRESDILLCNGLHAGPCVWPDGVVVEASVPSSNGMAAEDDEVAGTETGPDNDLAQDDEADIPNSPLSESTERPSPAMQLTESP